MVLRYANVLAASGWRVGVIFPAGVREGGAARKLIRFFRYLVLAASGRWSPQRWMTLHPGVKLSWVYRLESFQPPSADAVIATSVRTAELTSVWPASAGRRFYFVQGYETWDYPEERVIKSWRLPAVKIAVSQWLCSLIEAQGERVAHVPNGLDDEAFGVDRPLDQRAGGNVLWPCHRARFKGAEDVMAALRGVPGLRVVAFGTARQPRHWPAEWTYVRNPSPAQLRALYNQAAVFVAPSHSEGWGLPPCEALQCGCAVVASDIGGHREFLRHDSNALLYPAGDVHALAKSVMTLVGDAALRKRLSERGRDDLRAFSITASVARLKEVLAGGKTS